MDRPTISVIDLKPGDRVTLDTGGTVEVTDRPWVNLDGNQKITSFSIMSFALTTTETIEAMSLVLLRFAPDARVRVA